MKLFEMENFNLTVREEAWGLLPFKKLLTRDKTKDKVVCMKEVLFIYFYADIKSDYAYLLDDEERAEAIKKNVGLPSKWKIDKYVQAAIDLYKERSTTVAEQLYLASLQSAKDMASYLKNTHQLLYERDKNDKPVTDISKIANGLKQIPAIIGNLDKTYKEVIEKKKILEGRQKGARSFNMFEDGL